MAWKPELDHIYFVSLFPPSFPKRCCRAPRKKIWLLRSSLENALMTTPESEWRIEDVLHSEYVTSTAFANYFVEKYDWHC